MLPNNLLSLYLLLLIMWVLSSKITQYTRVILTVSNKHEEHCNTKQKNHRNKMHKDEHIFNWST